MTSERIEPDTGLTPAELRDEALDVPFLVWLTARATANLIDAALAPSGLTSDEFAIYSVLASDATITPSVLSQWMAAPPSTVTSYVKRFERRGHVDREPDPADRRSYRIQLTASGLAAHRSALALFAPTKAAISARLSGDEAIVREALLVLRPALDDVRATTS